MDTLQHLDDWEWRSLQRLVHECETDGDGCRLWTGYVGSNGYGYVSGRLSDGTMRTMKVHRLAYLAWVGELPQGLDVGHSCHDRDERCPGGPCKHRRCFEPTHLKPMSRGDNVRAGRKPGTKPEENP